MNKESEKRLKLLEDIASAAFKVRTCKGDYHQQSKAVINLDECLKKAGFNVFENQW